MKEREREREKYLNGFEVFATVREMPYSWNITFRFSYSCQRLPSVLKCLRDTNIYKHV